jgi:hypothetical protein
MQCAISRALDPVGRGVTANGCTSQKIGRLVKGFFSHAMNDTEFGGIMEQF